MNNSIYLISYMLVKCIESAVTSDTFIKYSHGLIKFCLCYSLKINKVWNQTLQNNLIIQNVPFQEHDILSYQNHQAENRL